MSLSIIPSNCTSVGGQMGIQGGIYSGAGGCGNITELVCQGNCSLAPITLTSGGFIVGETYYFIIDGCAGSVCDITIDVLSGFAPPAIGALGTISGPKKVCTGGTFNYSIPVPPGAADWHWTLDGTLLEDPTTANNNIDITFNSAGVFELCVDVSNFCIDVGAPPLQKCIDITVTDVVGIDPPVKYVCEDEEASYGGLLYGPGDYEITLQSWQGCDSVITLTVEPIIVPEKDLGDIYLCQGNCLTIKDTKGNEEILCDEEVGGSVTLESYNGCDSVINFNLYIMEIETKIVPPFELGCLTDYTPLDGNITENPGGYDIEFLWQAFNGGIIIGDPTEPQVDTETGGKYCLTTTITSPDGLTSCKDSACVIVKVDPTAPTAAIIGDTLTCTKDSITIIGVGTPVTSKYSWVIPGGGILTTKNIKVGQPGVYTLTVTAPNLCTAVEDITITADFAKPNNSVSGATLDCNNLSKVISGSSSTPNATFAWFDPSGNPISSNNNATVSIPGNYTFKVTNPKNGCTKDSVVAVIGDFLKPQNVTATGGTYNCSVFPIKVNGNSSSTPVTYVWTGPNSFNSNLQNPDAPGGGNYQLIVTGLNGCKDTAIATVVADTLSPNLTAAGGIIDCFTGSTDLSANSATPGTTFAWSGPGGTATGGVFNVNVSGTYTVIATGPNGCTKTTTVQAIDDTAEPIAFASVTSPITCDSVSVTLLGSTNLNLPTITYTWTGPVPFVTSNTKNTKTFVPGTYTLLVTNSANGCTDNITIDVLENIVPPQIAALNDTTDCISGQAILVGSSTTPNTSFQWLNSSGLALCPTASCTVPGAGTYTFVVTDPVNGCTSTTTADAVPDDQTPTLIVLKSDDLDCNVLSVDISTSTNTPGVNYKWTGTGAPITSISNFSTTAPSIYTVTITNPINGCINVQSIEVLQDIVKPIISATTDTIRCNTPTANVDGISNVTANTAVTWTNAGGNPISNFLDFSTTISGIYTLLVVNNSNGCSQTINLNVPENTVKPNASATGDIINCYEPLAVVNGATTTKGTTYLWTGPGNYNQTSLIAGNINVAGIYNLVITNVINGCTQDITVSVTEDIQAPQLTATGGTLTCTNNSQTIITSNSTTTPVTYSWSGPNNFTSNQAAPLALDPGTYIVTVQDTDNGCTSTQSIDVLSDEQAPDLTVNDLTLDCVFKNGDLNAISNTPGVTYQWTGPITGLTATLNVNLPGSYIAVVTAPNGCTTQKTSTVNLNAVLPLAFAAAEDELNCTNTTVDVNTNGSSFGTEYSYSWTGPNNFTSTATKLTVNTPGIYQLTILNTINGCIKDVTVEVPINDNRPTALTSSLLNPKCFGSSDGSVGITSVTGGTPPYLYSINGKAFSSTSQFAFLPEGIYNLTVQDAAGCELDTIINLIQPEKLTVDAGKDTIISWGEGLTLGAVSNNPNAIITWTPALDSFCVSCPNPKVQLFNEQLFTVTAIDSNNCKAVDQKIVLVKKERLVYIPNAFSPNGSGANDLFKVYTGKGVEEVQQFEVFDRWGTKIFETSDYRPNGDIGETPGWDGKFRGKKLNTAVFVYWALIKFKDGETILYKGDVTLTNPKQ